MINEVYYGINTADNKNLIAKVLNPDHKIQLSGAEGLAYLIYIDSRMTYDSSFGYFI